MNKKILLILIALSIMIISCEKNTTLYLEQINQKGFDKYFKTGEQDDKLNNYIFDEMLIYVFSPNAIPVDRFENFFTLVLRIYTNKKIESFNVVSTKIISEFIKGGVIETSNIINIDIIQALDFKYSKYKGAEAIIKRKSIIDESLRNKILIDKIHSKSIIEVVVTFEYMEEGIKKRHKVSTRFKIKIDKSSKYWDKMMSA